MKDKKIEGTFYFNDQEGKIAIENGIAKEDIKAGQELLFPMTKYEITEALEINAIEDIEAFWRNLGSRNKLFTVKIGDKIYENMELTYSKEGGVDEFIFKERVK